MPITQTCVVRDIFRNNCINPDIRECLQNALAKCFVTLPEFIIRPPAAASSLQPPLPHKGDYR